MRAIIVSHAYVPRPNRGKLHALTTLGCAVAAAVPARWADPRGSGVVETGWDDDAGVRIVPIPVRGDLADPADVRWDGRALRRLFRDFRPDVVQVEEEPWSSAAARVVAEAKADAVAEAEEETEQAEDADVLASAKASTPESTGDKEVPETEN